MRGPSCVGLGAGLITATLALPAWGQTYSGPPATYVSPGQGPGCAACSSCQNPALAPVIAEPGPARVVASPYRIYEPPEPSYYRYFEPRPWHFARQDWPFAAHVPYTTAYAPSVTTISPSPLASRMSGYPPSQVRPSTVLTDQSGTYAAYYGPDMNVTTARIGPPTPDSAIVPRTITAPELQTVGPNGVDAERPSVSWEGLKSLPDSVTFSVHVPAEARVFINDQPTTSAGEDRVYTSGGLQRGAEYDFHVRVDMLRDGQKYSGGETLRLSPGETGRLEFAAPDAAPAKPAPGAEEAPTPLRKATRT